MDNSNFEIIKDIFNIIEKPITCETDLINMTLNQKYLRSEKFKEKIITMIPKLKQKYKSHKLTCLHNNSLYKQKFPTINMIRQILKCNNLKLEPYVVCNGYEKNTNHKICERFFLIKKLEI
jgi:hypothetical protein